MEKSITFKVKSDSEFYQQYLKWKQADEAFRILADGFLTKYFPDSQNAKCIACSRLSVQLSQPDRIRCKTQILPNQVWYCGEGYWRFKQKSQYNKSWFTEVYQKIDASALHGLQSWQYEFRGRVLDSRLWEENGMVLGQIKGDKDILTIPSWAELITTPNTTKNSLPVPAGP